MKNTTIYFNKNLKYLVHNLSINQSELARILGITRQAIHNLIVANADPRLSTVIKIAEVYGIEVKDILFVDLEEKYKYKKVVILKSAK